MDKVTRTMNSNKNNEHRTTNNRINNTELHNRENSVLQVNKLGVYKQANLVITTEDTRTVGSCK
jgi:hypothetical protein